MTPSSFHLELPQGLIDRARSGEVAAFEVIYRRFERPVFNLALRMLGDAESAREILHDAMLKVFQRIGQYRNDAPFWAWLRQIALNEALMRLRRDKHIDDRVELTDVADESAPPWVRAIRSLLSARSVVCPRSRAACCGCITSKAMRIMRSPSSSAKA